MVNQPSIDIGISEQNRAAIAQGLSRLLADTYTLYLKTHNFHWNVTGLLFQTLHLMFETHYNELALAVDTIAERIRALGFFAPANFADFQRLTSIPTVEGHLPPDSTAMIRLLVDAHETVIRTARSMIALADSVEDEATLDLLTERTRDHEKTAWMLRSHLGTRGAEALV